MRSRSTPATSILQLGGEIRNERITIEESSKAVTPFRKNNEVCNLQDTVSGREDVAEGGDMMKIEEKSRERTTAEILRAGWVSH